MLDDQTAYSAGPRSMTNMDHVCIDDRYIYMCCARTQTAYKHAGYLLVVSSCFLGGSLVSVMSL